MWKVILDWLRRVVDKRICTVETFENACTVALEQVQMDRDGFISVKDAVRIIIKTIGTCRS